MAIFKISYELRYDSKTDTFAGSNVHLQNSGQLKREIWVDPTSNIIKIKKVLMYLCSTTSKIGHEQTSNISLTLIQDQKPLKRGIREGLNLWCYVRSQGNNLMVHIKDHLQDQKPLRTIFSTWLQTPKIPNHANNFLTLHHKGVLWVIIVYNQVQELMKLRSDLQNTRTITTVLQLN